MIYGRKRNNSIELNITSSTFSFFENSSMIFRQIETHYHLMMLSICDLGTFVFNFLVRLHPSLKGKKLEKLLED